MNSKFLFSIIIITILMIYLTGCTTKKQDTVIAKNGTDSLLLSRIPTIMPPMSSEQLRTSQAILRAALIWSEKGKLDSSIGNDSIASQLAEKLSLQSGTEYSPAAAGVLLLASKSVYARYQVEPSAQRSASVAESLFTAAKTGTQTVQLPFVKDSVVTIVTSGNSKEQLIGLMSKLFKINNAESQLLVDFIESEFQNYTTDDISSMVKGLISDGKQRPAQRKMVASQEQQPVEKDNSLLALKYRDQTSIRDSINKHLPDLEALYKKTLKRNSSIAGRIMITFRVNAAGEVISTQIKSSAIQDREFLGPFDDYVGTIKFKPIPAKIGNMTFDFPFEFSPEM